MENKDFRPSAYYDADEDCLELLIKPDKFYSKWVGNNVSIYFSEKDDTIVGVFIENVAL